MTSNDKKAPNRHSRAVTEGDNRAPNRAMLRAVGFGDDDFSKPIVAIANGQSDITPCNAGLGELALAAAGTVREDGGMPQTFGTITVSDGISMGTEGMKYSLVSREVIADSIETVCTGQSMDACLPLWFRLDSCPPESTRKVTLSMKMLEVQCVLMC